MKKILFLSIILLSLVSCNKTQTISKMESIPIDCQPIVGMPQTRGVITGTTFPTSRSMVVSADLATSTGVSSVTNYFSNVTFTYSSTPAAWAPSTTYYWPLSGGLEILAYSAGSASVTPTWTNATQVVLACSDCTADDILMGGATGATSSSKSVAFKHCLAQVNFKAKASVASVIKVKSITINVKKGANLTVTKSAGSASVSVATSLTGSAANVSAFSGNTALTTTSTAIGNALLIPAQTPASITVNYTITNNGTESAQMSTTKTLSTAMVAGSSYTLSIEATLTGINVTASLTDWANGGSTTVNI